MKTIKRIEIEPVFVNILPDTYDQGKVYISEPYKTSSHLCLCGCNNLVIMPLNIELFPDTHWGLIKEVNGTISFQGSVGNYSFPCKSHYIITKNIANFV